MIERWNETCLICLDFGNGIDLVCSGVFIIGRSLYGIVAYGLALLILTMVIVVTSIAMAQANILIAITILRCLFLVFRISISNARHTISAVRLWYCAFISSVDMVILQCFDISVYRHVPIIIRY